VKEIHRILRPSGIVYINVPSIFPFHADPDDFYRFTYKGINLLCEDLNASTAALTDDQHQPCTIFSCISWRCCLASKGGRFMVSTWIFRWLLFWVKYLDKFLAAYSMAYVIHAGAYLIGRKPGPSPRLG
jgi:hypothetical protein